MSDYPNDIDSFREIENIPGQEYDPDRKRTLYVEDLLQRSDAIIAIEQTLGENPEGESHDTVEARLTAIEESIPSINPDDYVRKTGDAMSGGLEIDNTGENDGRPGLSVESDETVAAEIKQTGSGDIQRWHKGGSQVAALYGDGTLELGDKVAAPKVNTDTLEAAAESEITAVSPVVFEQEVTLSGDPAQPLEAATKQYVDDHSSDPPDVQVFTATGSNQTWTKPAGKSVAVVIVISGGGGGGSGRKGTTSTLRNGGCGGGGGGYAELTTPIGALGSTETLYVGRGGTGGNAVTANTTNGNNGNDGEASYFGGFGDNTKLVVYGGGGGAGGTNASTAVDGGGVGYAGGMGDGGVGGGRAAAGVATAGGYTWHGGPGGGAGGGITTSNGTIASSAGGGIDSRQLYPGGTGFEGNGGAVNTQGQDATNLSSGVAPKTGQAGGGGGASTTTSGGRGGNGAKWGGGGGGGGAASNSVGNTGAGGAGGDGIIVVICY